MKASVKTVLGKVEYTFEIDEKSELDTLHKIAVLGNPPILCDECCNDKSEQFKLGSNKDKEGNCYVYIECLKCTAKAKLGQYKAGGGYFWHHFEKYVKKVA